jgi:myo-inositol-1(or 4)-monophosphatase
VVQSALINVMSAAAIKAGKGLLRDFGEIDQLHISKKGTANFVTATDVRTEKLLHRELSAARPNFGFMMEESGESEGKDKSHRWIIDPLDGTSNFIHAIPYFCISIALEKREPSGKSEIIAGVIFDPIHNELFAAEKYKGATLNDRRIVVSSRDKVEDSMLVTGGLRFSPKNDMTAFMLCDKAITSGATLRYFGATALDLANLAAGRFDACWYAQVQPWDIAAGLLILQEAGGMATDLGGAEATAYSGNLLASNRHMHNPMQLLIAKAA